MSISAVPSLWFAIANDGRVKYTTDSSRALKWKQSDSYRLVRDYYTAPPKREWVGLTEEEFSELLYFDGYLDDVEVPIIADLIRAVQAKLKEKNT